MMIRTATILSALLFGACASIQIADINVPPGEHIGEAVQDRQIKPLAEVQASPKNHLEQTLLVEAKVVAVCQTKGCWMQVEDGEYRSMVRWEEGCGGKYAFPKDAVGERILIQGSFYATDIDPDHIDHMKSEAGDGDLEVAEETFEMNASAVIMLDRAG